METTRKRVYEHVPVSRLIQELPGLAAESEEREQLLYEIVQNALSEFVGAVRAPVDLKQLAKDLFSIELRQERFNLFHSEERVYEFAINLLAKLAERVWEYTRFNLQADLALQYDKYRAVMRYLGRRKRPALDSELAARFPSISPEKLRELMETFRGAGLVRWGPRGPRTRKSGWILTHTGRSYVNEVFRNV